MPASTPTAGPRCPRCRRPLAAWRLDHCIYCGEAFPAELKEGFAAPEALKWVDRPDLPADVSKKLAMMKILPAATPKRTVSLVAVAGIVSIPIFAVIFYLLYTMVKRVSTGGAGIILVAGLGVTGYLIWIFSRAARK
ncbi:MAG TPA: hypothetical protein VGL03_14435 [Thermoanaerobaculia bacterium]|jgi:hypothetical protein